MIRLVDRVRMFLTVMYQGGKTKIAGRIKTVLLGLSGGRRRYLEPFLGSAAVFVEVIEGFDEAVGVDVQTDLMMMWQAAMGGWRAPRELSEEEYERLRRDEEPSALRGFAAYPCSFAGKRWGGYARDPKRAVNPFARRGSDSLERRAKVMREHGGVRLVDGAYDGAEIDGLVGEDWVVYCDPPYRGTLRYAGVGTFDHDRFWGRMEEWSDRGAMVLVSEYEAPKGWECVLEIDRHVSTALDNSGSRAVDRLFVMS